MTMLFLGRGGVLGGYWSSGPFWNSPSLIAVMRRSLQIASASRAVDAAEISARHFHESLVGELVESVRLMTPWIRHRPRYT